MGNTPSANKLRTARIQLGLTQEQAAALCGLSKSGIGRWELGNTGKTGGIAAAIRKYIDELERYRISKKLKLSIQLTPEDLVPDIFAA